MSKKYDVVSILRPTSDDQAIDSVNKSVTEIIQNNDGKVIEQDVWQKRN